MSIILRMLGALTIMVTSVALAWLLQIYPLLILALFAVPLHYDYTQWRKKT